MKSLSLSKPHLLVMVGVPGAGKSSFGEHFAETFKAPVINWGAIRAELFNEPTYSKDEQVIIGRVADYMLDELLKTQRTIVYEGATEARSERQALTKRARAAGYEVLLIWVQTDTTAAQQRATKKKKDGVSMTPAQFEAAVKRFTQPNHTESTVVISGKHTYASQLKIVLKRLVEPRAGLTPAPTAQPRPAARNVIIR